MSRMTRWAIVVFAVLGPLGGFTHAYPEWPTEVGLDVWNVPDIQAEMHRDQRRSDDLDHRLHVSLRRLNAKNEIAAELIAERQSLYESALAFRDLNATNPTFLPSIRNQYRHCSEDELHVRNVIDTVRLLTEGKSEQVAVMARLDAELGQLRRDAGGLKLGE